jgi:topoisomerase-4 subunit A
MGKALVPPGGGSDDNIEPVDLKAALEERYLAYALSTIMHRALPDVRDGLKPVHRRIMHAMRLLRLNPDQGFAKCARIVGEVMGKFHPHGDQSIYDALVRLAQDFSVRYPLVDGQGNFGNIDGDNAAAMRYTEARMTEVATSLLEGITEDAVDFRPTYNEEDEEPVVLPGAFPNLLANGSSGIAVGMATSIPPHNAAELCNAALHLIDHPDASVADLMTSPAQWEAMAADPVARLSCKVRGPDFPTGGSVVDDWPTILSAYETGRGGFRLRARWSQEDQGRGTWTIVVTEIPYGVQKARLIEKIAELLIARKLPLLEDIRDESAEDIRVVLVPKSRTVDPGLLMESLFKLTELEIRFPLNMNVLSRGKVPNVLSLKAVLREWLDHRKDVLLRRSRHRLAEIEKRLEILGGLLVAYLNIDEVIRIIREEDEPKQVMMARWSLTDVQAEAILNMRLRALRKLEEIEIRKEFDDLSKEKAQILSLLGSEASQWKTVRWEVANLLKKFGLDTEIGSRRTRFDAAPDHDVEDIQQAMIEKEPVTVVVSEKGWLRAMKGHISDHSLFTFKEGDSLKLAFPAQTTDKILVFTTGGKFYTIGADRLPGGRGHGEPIRIIVDMENDQDIVTAFVHDPRRKLLLVSHQGNGFIVPEAEVVANTRKGRQVMNVKAPDEASKCLPVAGDHVAIVGDNRKLLVFPLSEVPELTRGKGVRLQKYKDGGVLDAKTFAIETGLTWQDSADRVFTRGRAELADWIGERAGAGRMVPKGFPRTGKFG